MSRYWSQLVHNLSPYVPGEQPKIDNLVKLNTNENPYAPSPKVLDAINAELGDSGDSLRLYPDPTSEKLVASIANYFSAKGYDIQPDQVFVGNGSDEVLAHLFNGLLKHDKPILYPDITYSFYPVYCGLFEIDYKAIPLDENFAINIDDYQIENGGIILPNPNAPTGRLLALGDVETLVKNNLESVVVIDEAYIDFGGDTAIQLVNQYPNLLVTQTFSKSRSLAGLRIGYAIGHADLIEALVRVKDSFNSYPMDRVAIVAGSASFDDETYFVDTCHKIISSRDQVANELETLGFNVIPSAANFVFAEPPSAMSAEEVALALRERGVIVRFFNKPRIDKFLRITIGTDSENDALICALKEILI